MILKCFVLLSAFAIILASNVDQDSDLVNSPNMNSDVSGGGEDTVTVTPSLSNDTDNKGDNTGDDCYESVDDICPEGVPCEDLDADCLQCDLNKTCVYGTVERNIECQPKRNVVCTGTRTVLRSVHCRYCYQLEPWQYSCNASTTCSLLKPRNYYPAIPSYTAVCKTNPSEYCLGRRCYYKQRQCNWSRGYKWSTALILSITLGGFGVDRFYLGLWREGIGKLFSFGGLGVWTIVDVILIAVGYIGPQDGSLYI